MARKRKTPDGEDKRQAKARAQAARRQQVEALLQNALTAKPPGERPTVDDLVARLDEIREVALHCDPPQLSAAIQAVMGQAKLCGLLVDKSIAVTGKPDDFRAAADEEEIYTRLAERIGSDRTERFKAMIEYMRGDGAVIEGDANHDEDDEYET